MPMMSGSTPDTPPETTRAIGFSPALAGACAFVSTSDDAPAFVPGSDRAILLEPRDELRETIARRVGTDVLVLVHDHIALLLLHLDRHDLLREATVLACLRRETVAPLGELVGRVTRDPVPPAKV